ncbi:MAG: carbamoyltransferase [Chitinophagaceae bacterium]
MYILGISAYYHDAAAALLQDDTIIAAAQEERFTRIKHDENFPHNSVKFCLQQAAISINEIDAVVFYDKPFLKFERILETYLAYAPKGFFSFLKAIPLWIKDKLFLKKKIKDALFQIEKFDKKKLQILFCPHHLSHAASAYYCSPFNDSAIVTIDGVGEWATTSICKANGHTIQLYQELNFPHSVGLLYSAFTYFLGFKVNSGEYKLMGLAPYGNAGDSETAQFKEIILKHICNVFPDGSIWLNQEYFSYAYGFKMIDDKKWQTLFGFAKKKPDDEIMQQHCNLALAIQQIIEDIVIKMAITAKSLTNSDNLCMAGGVALNCVANGKLQQLNIFKNIYIQPAAGDAGGALGAAYAAYHIFFNQEKTNTKDKMQGASLGPSFSLENISYECRKNKLQFSQYDSGELNKYIASKIADGKIIGWFQGKMEFGPRALGNRSIIADARIEGMQQILNQRIKFRESFRPFAPAVLSEHANHYFEGSSDSPYMLFVDQVKNLLPLPKEYPSFSPAQKLSVKKSDLPAITHADGTARVQTVHKETNPHFWNLLNEFHKLTGCAVLINTSFNVRGEPMVCTPADAIDCFLHTDIDVVVMENVVVEKEKQTVNTGFIKRVFKED